MTSESYIFGWHTAEAVIDSASETVFEIWVDKHRDDARVRQFQSRADRLGIVIQRVDKNQLDRYVDDANHQGIVLRCRLPRVRLQNELKSHLDALQQPAFVLILDGVTDPHNLGACLRSADAAGVNAVIIPKDKAVGLTATVCKVASGAAHVLPVFQVTNLVQAMKQLQELGIWLYGTTGEAEQSLFATELKGAIGIVMGAEGKGMRRLTMENCDFLMNIPMQGMVSSLNVSVATGVVLFEALRQRQQPV